MTVTTGAAATAVMTVIAGPLSVWSVFVVVGWLLVLVFVWALLVAHGRRSPG